MILIRIASYSAFHPSNLINRVSFAVHVDQEHMDNITYLLPILIRIFFLSNYLFEVVCYFDRLAMTSMMNRISSSVKILPLFFLIYKEGREVRRKIENFIHHTAHFSTPSSIPHLPIFMHKFSRFLQTLFTI